MTTHPSETPLPPVLQLLRDLPAGELYQLGSKSDVADGIKDCERPAVSSAEYDQHNGRLTVHGRHRQIFCVTADQRLIFSCSCGAHTRGHCSHIVTAWACLKRLVSPASLQSIRFHPDNLQAVARLISQQDSSSTPAPTLLQRIAEQKKSTQKPTGREALSRTADSAPAEPYRLLLTQGYDSAMTGQFCRGNERLASWNSRNLPPDIHAFLLKHPYFSEDSRYLQAFLKLRRGTLPIIFRDEQGKETPLAYQPDIPLQAGLRFELNDATVRLLPVLDNDLPVPPDIVFGSELLVDPSAGTLRPLLNAEVWDLCSALETDGCWGDGEDDQLDGDEWDDDDDDDDDNPFARRSAPFDDPEELLDNAWLYNGVSCDLDWFNQSGVLLPVQQDSVLFNDLFFYHNGRQVTPEAVIPRYRLLAPAFSGDADTITLHPELLCNEIDLPLSRQAFDFIGNRHSRDLSGLIRTKKRYHLLLALAFSIAAVPDSAERSRIIRTGLNSPEFSKRELRDRARSFLEQFGRSCTIQDAQLTAHPDGWRCTRRDRREQARLLQLLYELYGHEYFIDTPSPGTVRLPMPLFLKTVPQLMERLNRLGARLEFAAAPVVGAQLQYSLDATSSGLDWFELKPEIRLEGELLTSDELQGLLDGNPFVQRGDRLLLLDELSSQVLAMFSSAMTVKKGKKGKHELVRVPRLQILDWLQLRQYGVEVTLSPRDAEVLESLLNFEQLPKTALPHGLTAELRHYQLDAWHWLSFLYRHRFGACLADDMGLGKTLQGITLLAGLISGALPSAAPPGSPHLVVAPPSLLFNWEAEIARFLPAAKVLLYAGTGRDSGQFSHHDIIITSYGIVQRDHEKLHELRFDVIIFDETQVVKNLQAATTNAVRKLQGTFALALTGTPVENHLGEYYAIMDLCLPGLLGSYDEFNRQITKEGTPAIQRLIQRTRPFVLRRTKQMIAAELPPKIETDIRLELSARQKALYQRTVEEVKGQVQEAYQNHAAAQARIIALTAILRLRQICLAPALAAATASDNSPKLEFLIEQLEELRDEGHSALVFSQFTGYLDIIEKGLKQHGLACLRLDGSTPVPQRKKLVQGFQNATEPMVFLISLKAGGKGLNLTRATYVYHMDPWWNPAVENQASDRAHRIGQTEQVTITRLIMRHTIEEKMMELKARKLELYKALLEDGTGSGGSGLTREDFEFLLG